MATKILLCSETFIKEHTNLSDNLSGAYLGPAIRETQDIELTEYLGSALVEKLCELVSSGTITETANAKYKAILDQAQYFLAYSSIAKVIPICSIKLDNFGASQSQDENIRTLGIEDLSTVTGWYQKKADTYAKKLMRYVLSIKSEIPELNECAAGQIKSHLNSAASTGLFLGGNRGRKVGSGSCCGGTSGGHSGGGGEGSVVTWEQTVTGGTKIATISIDGHSTEVFVPEGISEEDVNSLISQAIETETARTESTYAKTGETQDLDERLTNVESELAGLEVPSVYYIDGDSINNYSDVVDEIYRKLASGETVFVGSKYDYAKFPVGRAEIYEYQESDPSNPSEYLRREGFSVPVTRTDGADNYLLRYGTFSAFRYEGRDGDGHSAGLSWNENTLAISPLTLTAKISTGGTIYMNASEDNNSANLDRLYRLTKDSRNGIIMAKVYDLRINSAIGYTPVRFLGASSGNNDFYSFAKFTFDYTDTDGKTYRTLWTWDRSQPAATRIVLDSCEEVPEGSSGGDYVVVEDLSAITTPKEGMIAFVPEHTETMSGYTIDISAAGDYSCILRQYNPRERRWRIHRQWSEGFITCEEGGYWLRYGTDNAYHSFFNDAIYAKYDGSQYITVLFDSSVYTPNFNTSTDNYTETSDTVTKSARTYIYRYGAWRLYENGRITFYLNTMTQTTFNAMVNDIQLMKTPEVQFAADYQVSIYTTVMQHFLFPVSTTTVQNNRLEGLGFLYAVNDNYGNSFSNLYITNVHLEVGQAWQEWHIMLVNVKDYILTVASASNLGGVKVGNGLAIDENGVLSVS